MALAKKYKLEVAKGNWGSEYKATRHHRVAARVLVKRALWTIDLYSSHQFATVLRPGGREEMPYLAQWARWEIRRQNANYMVI